MRTRIDGTNPLFVYAGSRGTIASALLGRTKSVFRLGPICPALPGRNSGDHLRRDTICSDVLLVILNKS